MRFWKRRKSGIVGAAFEDYRRMSPDLYRRSIAEILAADTEAAAQLRRELEADTEIYLTEQWVGLHRRLTRDRALRRAVRRALRDHR